LCCAALIAGSGVGNADELVPPAPQADLDCKFRHAVIEVDALGKMPKPIADFVLSKTGEMAPRGGFFNDTDSIVGIAPGRRFIRAGHSGDAWFLWYERGGIAYGKQIAVFRLEPRAPLVIGHYWYEHENPCAMTDPLFDSKGPALPTDGQAMDW
jgi:hypothetical protein